MKKNLTLFLLLFTTTLFSNTKITLENIQEYKITKEKTLYKISAKIKKIDYKKQKKFKFYNKEKVISNSSYYLDGKFESGDLNMNFEKAYFLEGKFIMINTKGKYKNSPFKSKKAIYSRKDLLLKEVFITIEKRNYRKIKYKIVF